MWTRLSLPHILALGLTHCICGQSLDPTGIHLFHYTHGGKRTSSHDAIQNAFVSIVRDASFHVLWEQTHVLYSVLFNLFIDKSTLLCWLTTFAHWWCHHYWPHSSKLGITSGFFSWGDCDNGDSSEGRTLSWLLSSKCVSSSCHRSFWMSSPAIG